MIPPLPSYNIQEAPAHIECISLTVQDSMGVSSIFSPFSAIQRSSMQFNALKNRVSEISVFHENWDGQGAASISETVCKNTYKFLDQILKFRFDTMLSPESITPTPYGTIVLDFEEEESVISVEIGRTELGYFTEYNRDDLQDILSDGIETDFRTLPEELVAVLTILAEEKVYAHVNA